MTDLQPNQTGVIRTATYPRSNMRLTIREENMHQDSIYLIGGEKTQNDELVLLGPGFGILKDGGKGNSRSTIIDNQGNGTFLLVEGVENIIINPKTE